MPPRKAPPITLAGSPPLVPAVEGPPQHDAHVVAWRRAAGSAERRRRIGAGLVAESVRARRGIARAAISTFERGVTGMGHRMPAAPTAERLLRAGGTAKVERGLDHVVVYDDAGRADVKKHDVLRVRVHDTPFEALAHRGMLCPGDPAQNLVFAQAGRALLADWLEAGLSAVGSVDLQRDGAKGTAPALFRSEIAAEAFRSYYRAMEHLSPGERTVAQAIILGDETLAAAGRLIAYRSRSQAQAAAMAVLRSALWRLAGAYMLLDATRA